MNKKNIVIIVIFLFSIKLFSDNAIYELGPKINDTVIFTASRNYENKDTYATKALKTFAESLQDIKLSVRVIIAVTDNDIPPLPKIIPVKTSNNTKELIEKIRENKSAAVFIVSDGEPKSIQITAGSNKKTSPAWLLHDLLNALKKQNMKINFKTNSIILHRLGIITEDKMLNEYLEAEIPAIKIASNENIAPLLTELIHTYSVNGISKKWDKHYNIKHIFSYTIISEKKLIIIILIITFAGLLYIFMFSFLFGKKKEKHIKDLLHLWHVPVLFLLFNMTSFYLSEYIIKLAFYINSNNAALIEFPFTAVFLKFLIGSSISFFLFNIFTAKLPKNTFVYAYLTSFVCFINIFIFLRFDLSLSLMFLEIYIISFLSAKIKKIPIQMFFLFLHAALILYYFYPVLIMPNNITETFFYAHHFTASIFFIPYDLSMHRLILRIKKDTGFTISKALLFACTLISIIGSFIYILTRTHFSEKFNDNIFLVYEIAKNGNTAKILSDDNRFETVINNNHADLQKIQTDEFIHTETKLENYLERSIGEIKISPLKEAAAIRVGFTKETGSPIYEANEDFTVEASGNTIYFYSPLNTQEPFIIRFSAEKNTHLSIKINAWFYHTNESRLIQEALTALLNNSDKINKNNNTVFLFKIEKELELTAKDAGNE